jgi:glutathione reductase (NADPH)
MQSPPFDYDLFVIGAGSGGVRASRVAAGLGARVGICEESRVGGTCVIRGCVPKKLLVYAAHYGEDLDDSRAYGWDVPEPRFDWSRLIANKDREIDRLNGVYISMLDKAGVDLFEERGVMEDDHTVRVGERRVTARHILIATGGRPVKPDIPGAELAITSDEAFHLSSLPERVVVVGGGYIGVEFAGIFNGLGSQVTQIYRRDRILRGFDGDVRDAVTEGMRERGVDLRTEVNVTAIERDGTALRISLTDGTDIRADQVMFATGRNPHTRDLGCDAAGVELDDRGAVRVDEYSASTAASVHAVGDVTDRLALTPVALMEGQALARTLFGDARVAPDHVNVPSAVFSLPPVGSVGMSEEAAREHGDLRIYRARFRPMRHTMTGREDRSLMKLVVDAASDRVVGCHMVGEDAPEIVQGMAVGVKAGLTKAQFDDTVGIHPTAGEEFVTMRTPAAA